MNIVCQLEMMLPLPTIYGPADYREFRGILEQVNRILETDDLEWGFVADDLEHCGCTSPTMRDIEMRRKMIRCNILKSITGLDYRELAIRLADSVLFQWFTRYNTLDACRTPSKSTLERFYKLFEIDQVRMLIDRSIQAMQKPDIAGEILGRHEGISVGEVFADSTCLKAPIHFPVDWVLLRDGVRTLVKAMLCIRRQGLLHRMPSPESFLSKINGLSIAMSQARRRTDSQRQRKSVLRKMKRLSKTVGEHGRRYHELLAAGWEGTSWTKPQADRVLERIENVLTQLPEAMRQAHERIIGGRQVASSDKLLSLYEDDVHIIVRGKANAEVEFGNGLYLVEQQDGLIVDWEFFKEHPPADSSCVAGSLERIDERFGPIQSYTADRGFCSKHTAELVDTKGIVNGICPKDPAKLSERMTDDSFRALQKRRAQTEGRIGILKNAFLSNPVQCHGYSNRHNTVAWCVLAHNLWSLGRMAWEKSEATRQACAA